jgi:hypothetical protein
MPVPLPRTIHVFVALADNAHQGIIPVPARIGNGDDPANNLYWGCSEGVRSYFSESRQWKRQSVQRFAKGPIIERCQFRHARHEATLIADAYRGREIRRATTDFLDAAIRVGDATPQDESLVAYIGHNGLMDFTLPARSISPIASDRPAIVLCCKSEAYFGRMLRAAGAKPVLMTTQLMYPGAFLLHDALEVFLTGGDVMKMREAAAKAYALNQKISVRAARGVFAKITAEVPRSTVAGQ